MILGTGIDMALISRFRKHEEDETFLNRFYSDSEVEYIQSKKSRAESMAGRFAAREAFFKALGTGFEGFSLKDVSVLRDDRGKPYIEPGDRVRDYLRKLGNDVKIHLSISHDRDYAIAQVILEE